MSDKYPLDDPLDDFEREDFTHDRTVHRVYRSGQGPAVIVMSEIPGITPRVAGFCRRVREIGCTVVVPDLFGFAGRDPNPAAHGLRRAAVTTGVGMVQVCVRREFTLLAAGRSSPVVNWLRALAAHEHERCGGPGVGAVGMCLTGGFALGMAVDERVVAPVLSQPSLPLAVGRKRRASIDTSPQDLQRVRARCDEGLKVVGMRFRSDKFVPAERFSYLREQLGDALVAVELEDADANPEGVLPPHSVLTEHLIDAPGEPTRDALDTVLDLFRQRLLV